MPHLYIRNIYNIKGVCKNLTFSTSIIGPISSPPPIPSSADVIPIQNEITGINIDFVSQ